MTLSERDLLFALTDVTQQLLKRVTNSPLVSVKLKTELEPLAHLLERCKTKAIESRL